ncbi:MAG: hypothetical protein ACJ78Q_15945 [Chloroflexia bacterium]
MEDQSNPRLISEVSSLLSICESAHGRYEAEALGGVRDEEWPKWYADYLLAHGLLDLFPRPGAAENLQAHLHELLTEADRQHRTNAPNDDWHDYYARFLVTQV